MKLFGAGPQQSCLALDQQLGPCCLCLAAAFPTWNTGTWTFGPSGRVPDKWSLVMSFWLLWEWRCGFWAGVLLTAGTQSTTQLAACGTCRASCGKLKDRFCGGFCSLPVATSLLGQRALQILWQLPAMSAPCPASELATGWAGGVQVNPTGCLVNCVDQRRQGPLIREPPSPRHFGQLRSRRAGGEAR